MNNKVHVTIGSAHLYHADCLEMINDMNHFPDMAVISDPPYGIGFVHSGKGGKTPSAKLVARGNPKIVGDDKPFDPAVWVKFCDNVMLLGADHFHARLPDSGRWLAWNKLAGIETWDSFSDVEFIWHSKKGAARIFSMLWKGLSAEKLNEDNADDRGERYHVTQKPVRLMRWMIKEAGNPKLVIDPYMGSGTTGVACVHAQCAFIGIEKEKDNYDKACWRIDRAYRSMPRPLV